MSTSSFPLGVLPKLLAELAAAVSEASDIQTDFTVVPGLSVLAAASAGSAELELSPAFHVSPIVWTCTSSPPGAAKTPGQRQVVRPLERLEEDWDRDYQARLELYRAEHGPSPKKTAPAPAQRRILVKSSTIEALPSIMLDNPGAGLLWEHSELASIVGGLDPVPRQWQGTERWPG